MNQSQFLATTCNLLEAREKMTRTWCDWFWFGFSLVEKLARAALITSDDQCMYETLSL